MEFKHLIVNKYIQKSCKSVPKVVVRFPPEPSGYLHLGHIKALYINSCIAKHFNGQLIVRFDDTNPLLESDEYEKAILEDLNSLKTDLSKITYTSDSFNQLIEYANQLIEKGLAYVDLTEKSEMKIMRNNGTPSDYRDETPSQVKQRWTDMQSGVQTSGALRLKIDLNHKNKAMRDPTIYRVINAPHHRTGNQFKVYPMYDFACPIVDSLEEVTHVFRSTEYLERIDQTNFILDHLKLQKPFFYHYGRISIKDAELSKRAIKKGIAENLYSGWSDPRLYTYRGMLQRGLQLSALEDFMKETGYSTCSVTIEPSSLWQINRKYIDKIATRYMVIDPVYKKYKVTPLHKSSIIPRYKNNPSLGTREIFYDNEILISDPVDKTFCLVNWGAKIPLIHSDGKFVEDTNQSDQYVMWVTDKYVDISITTVDGKTLINKNYLGEEAMKFILVGDIIQIMQKNYYKCIANKCIDNSGNLIELLEIC